MKALSNKQLLVLQVIRDLGSPDVMAVVDEVHRRVRCSVCDGVEQRHKGSARCGGCYGWGHVPFSYSDAYVAMRALMSRDLITRSHPVDQFGDETRGWIWTLSNHEADPTDPLEILYALPTREE